MKKIILIAFILGLFSCNKKEKDWTCTCEIHSSSHTTITKQVTSKSKSDASSQCTDYGKSQAGTSHYECNVQ
ncbi:MAG: hypothetical protein IPJ32_11265 [Sphingobacteriaceae bacterium]|nr:hypothetical protein [Sphingobacteriaceae bacterium]